MHIYINLINFFRYNVERFVMGIPAVVSFNPDDLRSSLGPGYKRGWYAWRSLDSRKDNCNVQEYNQSFTDALLDRYQEVREKLSTAVSFEDFGETLERRYHPRGHNLIGEACSTHQHGKFGLLTFSEASARDPFFWTWHQHLNDLVQEYISKTDPNA